MTKTAFAQSVTVGSFSPVSQIPGKSNTVNGGNFASSGITVTVGGTSASYSYLSSSVILVTPFNL